MNQDWIAGKFEGLDRKQLREAGEELGCNFGPNTSEKIMRIRLCEKLGEGIPEIPQESAEVKVEQIRMQRMMRPRLAPGDKWEGRRHDVFVNRNQTEEKHKSFILYWNFAASSFPFEETIHMPEPYFNLLKNAKIGRIIQEPIFDERNFQTATNNKEVYTPKFSYNYYGVTKGTENLPGSILEYWQLEAKKSNYFRDFISKSIGRNRLIQIRADLYGSVGVGFYKDLTNEDIWQDVIRFLGYEDIFYEEIEEHAA